MSNLSLARIMYGGSEEVRRIAGTGVTMSVASLAPLPLAPSAVAQLPSTVSEFLRRVWLRLSAKS